MKRIFKLGLISLVLTFSVASCELERFPYDQIEQTQAFQTMKDAATLNNGMYAQLRNRMYGIFMYSTDVQADQFNATLDFGNRNGFPHRWEGFLAGDYTIRDTWQYYYSALVNVNNIIQNMGLIPTANATEEATLNKYLGEAYFLRAFYNHQMVIRWGKPYDAASSANDLGIPLVLVFDPTLKPARATVQQVYQQILDDLTSAKALLPAGGAPNSNRITHDAALALESRVKLHMKDWNGVVSAATAVVNSGRYSLITTEAGLVQMWENDMSSEVIFQVDASAPSELPMASPSAINNIYIGFSPSINRYTPDFVPSQWVVDLFADNDIRKDVYLQPKPLRIQGFDYEDVYLMVKYPGNPVLWTAANSNYQHKPKVLRLAETMLNLAEAQFYLNEGDARNTINALRAARGLAGLEATVTGQALLDEIRTERTRELLGEGFRLNDLMRWNLPVVRRDPQTPSDFLNLGAGYTELNKPAGDPQFIWGIPSNDLTTNPNLVQNPGW